MAKKLARAATQAAPEMLRVQLIPTTNLSASDPLRLKEINELVAQIVLLGQKRGRPSRKEEVNQDAA